MDLRRVTLSPHSPPLSCPSFFLSHPPLPPPKLRSRYNCSAQFLPLIPRRRRGVATRTTARTDESRKDANARLPEKLPAVGRQPRNGRMNPPVFSACRAREGYGLPKQEARVTPPEKYICYCDRWTVKNIFHVYLSLKNELLLPTAGRNLPMRKDASVSANDCRAEFGQPNIYSDSYVLSAWSMRQQNWRATREKSGCILHVVFLPRLPLSLSPPPRPSLSVLLPCFQFYFWNYLLLGAANTYGNVRFATNYCNTPANADILVTIANA